MKLSSLWKDILHIFLVYKVVKMLNSDSEEEEIVVVSCLLAEEEEQKVKKRKIEKAKEVNIGSSR